MKRIGAVTAAIVSIIISGVSLSTPISGFVGMQAQVRTDTLATTVMDQRRIATNGADLSPLSVTTEAVAPGLGFARGSANATWGADGNSGIVRFVQAYEVSGAAATTGNPAAGFSSFYFDGAAPGFGNFSYDFVADFSGTLTIDYTLVGTGTIFGINGWYIGMAELPLGALDPALPNFSQVVIGDPFNANLLGSTSFSIVQGAIYRFGFGNFAGYGGAEIPPAALTSEFRFSMQNYQVSTPLTWLLIASGLIAFAGISPRNRRAGKHPR